MIKVLIADDEELFREGIVADVDWKKIGMNIVGLAEDGKQALDLVGQTAPDIIVTDIRMPYIDGLEFIQQAKTIQPDLFFIIISGHDEFEYAQKAISLGVREFLLKPLDEDDLELSLLKVKDEIIKNKKANLENNLRDTVLRYKMISSDDNKNFHRIIIVQWDDYFSDDSNCRSFYEMIEGAIHNDTGNFVIERRGGDVVIGLSASSENSIEKLTRKTVNSLREKCSDDLSFSMTIGAGGICPEINNLPTSYHNARAAVGRKFLEGKNHTFIYEEKDEIKKGGFGELSGWDMAVLISAVKTENISQFEKEIDKLVQAISKMGQDSFLYGLILVGTIFSEALKLIESSSGQSDDILSESTGIYKQITSRQTIEEMLTELKNFLYRIMNHLTLKRNGGHGLFFDRIREYTKQHFDDTGITLQSVAEEFGISAGHLCSLFKNYSEDTFKEYLTHLRMESAKELISSSDLMIFEIAFKVGYSNPTYFNSLFKKYTGMSPGRFKRKKT